VLLYSAVITYCVLLVSQALGRFLYESLMSTSGRDEWRREPVGPYGSMWSVLCMYGHGNTSSYHFNSMNIYFILEQDGEVSCEVIKIKINKKQEPTRDGRMLI